MNIDWKKIKNGFRGFENLAVEFVKEKEVQTGNSWKKTKNTRDKNHDAILSHEKSGKKEPDVAVFVGYSNNVDVWWMEAKYSATDYNTNKFINRYRLDATIVSAILSKNISKVVFVTNLNISVKTISDIRKVLIFSGSCREVVFYTKNHLEHWLLNKPYSWFKKRFQYSKHEYNQLNFPTYNCIEELSLYKLGDNLFQEPLNTVYTNFLYELHFSIFVQRHYTATLKKSSNIKLLSDKYKELELQVGLNEYVFNVKIPNNLEHEKIQKKDVIGEYKEILPISLTYELVDDRCSDINKLEIIPTTALKIIDSDYFYLNIPSQNSICNEILKEALNHINDPERCFSLFSLYGKSGIGKSFVLQLFKNKLIESNNYLITYSYVFSGNKIDDMILLKKFIFNLFFPFIYFSDLDEEYVEKLQKENIYLTAEFWNLVYYTEDIESFMNFIKNKGSLLKVFPKEIGINLRTIIFDDTQKLAYEYHEMLKLLINIFINNKYPIFLIIASQNEINLKEYRIGKEQYLFSREVYISKSDISNIFNTRFQFTELNNVSILFGSVIEIIYFLKYVNSLDDEIKNIEDFKFAYNLFQSSEILNNEIISKFRTVFRQNSEAEALCSSIYYASPGIHRDRIKFSPKSARLVDLLLENELIKKDENDFYINWHDYYKKIFMSNFPLIVYDEISLPFKNTYDVKIQFDLEKNDDKVVENVINYLHSLFSKQKYYEIYYILENVFANETVRNGYKNQIKSSNYFLLFAYFCYANTNAGTVFSGYELFNILYLETGKSTNITVQTIHYIMLWEIINSLYERDQYEEAMEKINIFYQIPRNIQENWVYLFEWDFKSINYSVGTIKLLIDSENGINCLDKVPKQEMLQNKDVAFSTYRLLLSNLTNDFNAACKLLRKYNYVIRKSDKYDTKTKYMYNFAVNFLDCLNNKVDVNEVICANNLLKNDYFNDYNRHIFVIAILALLKQNITLCEEYRMEFIKTNRPMNTRQQAFQALYSALIYLYNFHKEKALNELNNVKKLFEKKNSYLLVVSHNINYVKEKDFSLHNVEFYLGGKLYAEKYYIDIRMLY